MKEYFVNTLEQLRDIENEFDYNFDFIGVSSKYSNYTLYRDKEENVDVYLMQIK